MMLSGAEYIYISLVGSVLILWDRFFLDFCYVFDCLKVEINEFCFDRAHINQNKCLKMYIEC